MDTSAGPVKKCPTCVHPGTYTVLYRPYRKVKEWKHVKTLQKGNAQHVRPFHSFKLGMIK